MPDKNDERIHGKVAQVLSNTALVINRGSDDGVLIGMRFAVLNRQGADIKDPDTGDVLGSVEVAKTIVKVIKIEGPHLAVARTFRKVPGTKGLTSGLLMPDIFSGTPERLETLRVSPGSSVDVELNPKDSFIAIGDPVVEAKGEEFDYVPVN